MKYRSSGFFSLVVFILVAGCRENCEDRVAFLPDDFYRVYENTETLVYEVKDSDPPFVVDTFVLIKRYDKYVFVESDAEFKECQAFRQAYTASFSSIDEKMAFEYTLTAPRETHESLKTSLRLEVKSVDLMLPGTDSQLNNDVQAEVFPFNFGGSAKFTTDSGFVQANYGSHTVKRIE